MGCTQSNLSPEQQAQLDEWAKISKQLDKQAAVKKDEDEFVRKVLLLGAGESGKSTIVRQMQIIYGSGFTDVERMGYIQAIHGNVMESIIQLVTQSDLLHKKKGYNTKVGPDCEKFKEFILQSKKMSVIGKDIAEAIKALWADKGIQETYFHRADFQLPDSTKYFFKRIEEVCKENYIPNDQDIFRSRIRTTGTRKIDFQMDEGLTVQMVDVGGQRNERRKWIHCFDNVTSLIFVAAIGAYNQVLFEDEKTNRIEESLNLFATMVNSDVFQNIDVILFLNKSDIFHEKFPKYPLKDHFPRFSGETVEDGIKFMEKMFRSRRKESKKELFVHATTATDTENVTRVFNSVAYILVRDNVGMSGIM